MFRSFRVALACFASVAALSASTGTAFASTYNPTCAEATAAVAAAQANADAANAALAAIPVTNPPSVAYQKARAAAQVAAAELSIAQQRKTFACGS